MKSWHKGLLLIVCIATALLVLFFDRAAMGGDSYPQAQFWRYRVNGTGDRLMLPTISAAGLSINGKLFVNKDAQFNSCVVVEKNLNVYGTLVQAWGTTSSENIKTFSGPGLKVQGYMLRVNAGNGLATGATYGSDVHAVASTAIRANAAGLSVKYDAKNFSANAGSGLLLGPNISLYSATSSAIALSIYGSPFTVDRMRVRGKDGVMRFSINQWGSPVSDEFVGGYGRVTLGNPGYSVLLSSAPNLDQVITRVRGSQGQTVNNLQSWAAYSGTVLASVGPKGAATFPQVNATTGTSSTVPLKVGGLFNSNRAEFSGDDGIMRTWVDRYGYVRTPIIGLTTAGQIQISSGGSPTAGLLAMVGFITNSPTFSIKPAAGTVYDNVTFLNSAGSKVAYVTTTGMGAFRTLYHPPLASPARTLEGNTAYADSTGWNPGAGKGLYVYTGTAWAKLH